MKIGDITGTLRLKDELSASVRRSLSSLDQLASKSRGVQSAVADLERQMQKLSKTPAMRADAVSSGQALAAIKAQNRALEESIAAYKKGPAAVSALNRERQVLNGLLSVGVTRESSYGRAIEGTLRKKQALQSELKKVSSGYREVARTADASRGSILGAAAAIARNVAVAAAVSLALYGVARAFSSGVSAAEEYSRSLTKIVNVTDVTRAQINAWKGDLDEISRSMGRLPQDVVAGLTVITSAGFAGKEAMEITEEAAKAAAIGLGEMRDIGRAVSAAMMAYGPEALSAARATNILLATVRLGAAEANELAPALGRVFGIAQQLGVSFEEVGASVATFTRLGVPAEEAVIGLRATLMLLLGPTKQQKDELKKLGMTMQDLRREIDEGGLAQALVTMLDKLGGNEDALARIIPEIRSLAFVLGTAGAQGKNFVKIQEDIKSGTDEVGLAIKELADDPAFKLDQARASWAIFKRQVGEEVLPALIETGKAFMLIFGPDTQEAARNLGTGIAAIVGHLDDIAKRSGVLGWVLKLREMTNEWKANSDAATQFNLEMIELEGKARDFSMIMAQPGPGTRRSVLNVAWEDAKRLAEKVNEAKESVKNLTAEWDKGPKTKPVRGRGDVFTVVVAKPVGLVEAEKELKKATEAYELMKKGLRSVGVVFEDISKPGGPIKKHTAAVEELSDAEKELAEDLARVKEELISAAAASRASLADLLSGMSMEESEREQKLYIAYLRDIDKFGKVAANTLLGLRRAASNAELELEAYKDLAKKQEEFVKEVHTEAIASIKARNDAWADELLDTLRTSLFHWRDFMQEAADTFTQMQIEQRDLMGDIVSFTQGPYKSALFDAETQFLRYVSRIKELAIKYPDLAEQAAEAILAAEEKLARDRLEILQRHIAEQLSNWSDLFSYLSDEFGGFFNYLSSLVNRLQQAQGAGQSVSGIATGMGASAGTASALGTFVTVIGVWKAIYDIGMGILRDNKSKKFGQAGGITVEGGVTRLTTSGGIGQVSSDAIKAIRDTIKAFEDALHISVNDLAEIGIKLRNDGKKIRAYVAGVLVGEFNDLMEAVQFAVARAITTGGAAFSGMSDLMVEGLKKLPKTSDLDSIVEFLSNLAEVGDLGLTDAIVTLKDTTRHFDELWDAITRVKSASAAVEQGFNNLIQAEGRLWQQLFDSISGREKTAAEVMTDKVRELNMAKVELAIRKAQIAQRLVQIQVEIAATRSSRILIGGGGGGGVAGGGVLGVTKAFATAGQVLAQTAVTVVGATIAMSLGASSMIEALEAEQRALLELQKLLDTLIIPDVGDIRIPKTGGGGTDSRDAVRDFIRDRTFELGLRGLSDYLRAVAEVNRQYEEQLEQAGRDIVLRGELIELKERELALLAKEQKDTVVESFQNFLGLVNPFDEIRKTAAGLIKDIEESPFGDARKARMIGRVLDELERQIEMLAQEMAVNLFGQLIGDLEKFGADEQLLLAARQAMAVLEHTLKMIHYREEIEILRAAGKIAPEVLKTLDDALKFLEGIDPLKLLGPVGDILRIDPAWLARQDHEGEIARKLADDLKRALDMLKSYTDDALPDFIRQINKVNEDFAFISRVLGNTEAVYTAHAKAINKIIIDWLEPVIDARRRMDFGELSTFTGEQQFATIRDQFRQVAQAILGGDLDRRDQFLELAEQYRELGAGFTGGEGFRFIDKEIKGIFDTLIASIPGFASGTIPLGMAANPMAMQAPEIQAAIEEGNIIIADELRAQTDVLRSVQDDTADIRSTLRNPLSVRNVA